MYTFLTDCINASAKDLENLEDTMVEVNYSTIEKNIDAEELAKIFPIYENCKLTLKTDWAVNFRKGIYRKKKVIVIIHSAIEYIFQESK